MGDANDREELADRVAALEDRLSTLQGELSRRERDRGPRIPTPREVLRATDDHAIPAIIAILQAHIHALRLLQRTVRMLAPPDSDSPTGPRRPPGFQRVARSLGSQLDELVADLDEATETVDSSRLDPLIEEARDIRAELGAMSDEARAASDRTDASADGSPEGGSPDEREPDADPVPDPDPPIDVDAELRSIKADLGEDNGATPPSETEEDEDDAGDGEAGEPD